MESMKNEETQGEKRPEGEMVGNPKKDSDGQWYNKFVEKISQDDAYSDLFWEKQKKLGNKPELIEKQKAVMAGIIKDAIKPGETVGKFGHAVEQVGGMTQELEKGIPESDKEKLSAYRVLAKELGYEIGLFQKNPKNWTVTAEIKKLSNSETTGDKNTENLTEKELEKRRNIISPLGNKRMP